MDDKISAIWTMSIKIFIYANRIDVHVSFQYTCSSLGENIVIFATIIVVSQHNFLWKCTASLTFVITRVSEVIMFSPCVFVCLCIYHNVYPDDLTMKDWCHTNNILQVHYWGCLVMQVMSHALMTSSMVSPGHIVGQILKLIHLCQYLS